MPARLPGAARNAHNGCRSPSHPGPVFPLCHIMPARLRVDGGCVFSCCRLACNTSFSWNVLHGQFYLNPGASRCSRPSEFRSSPSGTGWVLQVRALSLVTFLPCPHVTSPWHMLGEGVVQGLSGASSYKDTSPEGSGPHRVSPSNLHYSLGGLFSKHSHTGGQSFSIGVWQRLGPGHMLAISGCSLWLLMGTCSSSF